MAEYIERSETVDALNRLCNRVCQYSKVQRKYMCGACPLGDAFTVIEDGISAADVRPVVRGKWIVSRTDYGWNGAEFPTHCKCTECGREVPYQDKDNFCPNCGARMEES